MKKLLFFFFVFLTFSLSVFPQARGLSAKDVIEGASKKSSLEDPTAYLRQSVQSVPDGAERRAVHAFLAAVLEQQGQYSEARDNYVRAASIQGSAGGAVKGLLNKSSEELVIDAVRCALCAGDYASAESYLNSAVRNSKDEGVRALVKLYEQWASLCRAHDESETRESVAMLRAYASLDSMISVRPSVLLTLWHLTGESGFAESLKKSYPKSMEAAIVKGEIQTLPTPFWYFVPRSGADLPEVTGETFASAASKDSPRQAAQNAEKVVRQQLGLFREVSNAESLVRGLAEKGFRAEITSETRPSGTKYYLVVVSENSEGTMGEELRTAGFECYPIFE